MEVETTLQFATDILAFLCVFFGGESFPHFREQLVNVTKAWHEGKITDGVYAAVIRSIGKHYYLRFEILVELELRYLLNHLTIEN